MSGRRGAALVVVLWLIVILSAIGTEVAVATRSSTGLAANYRARVVARYAAESGVEAAVATLEDRLASARDQEARRAYLNALGTALDWGEALPLGEGRVAVALIDPGSRLDVNTAAASQLTTLFAYFIDPMRAADAAAAVRGAVEARPLASLDELSRVPGVPPELIAQASGLLTVDGDGTINRATASDTVLAVAGGELRDEPARIVVVSRGWQDGHRLTHEIEAVYAVVGNELALVRWRERDL